MNWTHLDLGNVSISAPIVISIAAFVTALAAILLCVGEMRRSRYVFGLKVLFEINEFFHSRSMLETRQKAASALLENAYDEHVERLLDFFEVVGYLTKRRLIRKQVVWSTLAYWIIRYWYASRAAIEKERQRTPRRWEHMARLFHSLSKMDRKKYGLSVLTQDTMRAFLEKERDSLLP